MNKRASSLTGLVAFCLVLASCATEPAHTPVASAPSATATIAPLHISPALSPAVPTSPSNSTPIPTQPPPTEPPPALTTHTVQPGDTLLGLASQYGVPMAALQLQNEMGDSIVVQVGQVLSIPPQAGWEGAAATLPFNWEGASRYWVVHVVEAGETLVGIAQSYGLKAAELKAVNGLADADRIGIGQELVLPLDAPAVALAPTPTASATAPPTYTPTPPSSSTPVPPPSTSTATPAALPSAAPPPADIASWPHEISRLINETRAQHGLPPLAYNDTLAQAAQAHANDCLQRGWGSHYGSDGSNERIRMERAGYDPVYWDESWAHTQSPSRAMDFWMDEAPPNDPHRRMILSTRFTEIGVGVVKADWGYYIFADFGKPRD
jgi:uncharacterized protein YkwD